MELKRKLRRFRRSAKGWFWAALLFVPRSIIWLLSATGHTLTAWWGHRHLRYLIRGLPTLIVAGLCTFLAVGAAIEPPSVLAETYKQAAKSAFASGSFDAAKLFYRRVVELDAADNEALFELAKAAQETDDNPRLAALMQQLAPVDRPVHHQAHVWQASVHYLQSGGSVDQLRLAETHLRHALALRPDDDNTHAMLGEVYFQMGLFSQTVSQLSPLASEHPEVRLSLAKAYALDDNEERARFWGEQARAFYEKTLGGNPRDLETRIQLADCLMFLEQYRESDQVLRNGLKLHQDDTAALQRMQAGLARVYAAWSDSFTDATDSARTRRFELLSKGLLLNPNDIVLFDRMMRLLREGDETAQQSREFLLDNIAQGRALAISHLLLGSVALELSAPDEAGFHLQRAFDAAPNAPIIANNLAWYLVHADPPQPEQALQLIERVVRQLPGDPRVLDTRGQILLALGRHEEAIRDLEAALPSHSANPATHRALSDAYRALGRIEMADRHQRISEELAP